MFCRSELARLVKLKPEIESNGARIVVLTLGKPEEAQAFCGERAPGLDCYANPSAEVYKAYGLARANPAQLFGPSVWLQGALAVAEGQFEGIPIGKPVGDPWQMPGVFVVRQDSAKESERETNVGRVQFAYYSKHAGDYPSDALLIRAGKMGGE